MSSYDSQIGVNWLIRPRRHRGVDFPAPVGTPVLATAPGTVTKVYLKPTVGWIVRIHHKAENWDTRYLHLESASVKPGDAVKRGQSIGVIGLFENSAGVEHVHVELYDRNATARGERAIRDPMEFMASCFDTHSKLTYGSHLLTYPIVCQPSWTNETRPVESKWTGAGIQLELGAIHTNSIGLRSRGILATPLNVPRITLFAGWNLGSGFTYDKRFLYDATLLTGPGFAHGLFDFGLLSGIGFSTTTDVTPPAVSIPMMVFLRSKHRYLWATAWMRTSWVLDSPRRQDGAFLSPLGIDELAIGAQVRIPPLTKWATELSLEYQQRTEESRLLLGIGMSLR